MKNFFFLVSILNLSGCAQVVSDYYYASLEAIPDIKIVSVGKVHLKNLEGNSEIPTGYELERAGYKLRFLVKSTSYYPHFQISVEGSNAADLVLRPNNDYRVTSSTGIACASYYFNGNSPSTLDFGWSSDCISDDIDRYISFDVVGISGELVAKESLPFQLKRDGKYRILDAI
jgi:hypothetical protein